MKKHSRFMSVAKYVLASKPADLLQVEVLVSKALKDLPDKEGVKKPSFRRDVVIAHGYRGVGSQKLLSKELWEFWNGENEDVLGRLDDYHSEEMKSVRAACKAQVLTFKDWFESQNPERLINKMARRLHKRYPMEDFDECLSMVGLCVAQWLSEGNLDAKIAEKGDMSVTLLNTWIRRRHLNEVNSRGKEPLFRMKGARTNSEKTSIWRDGNTSGIAEEAVKSGDWAVALSDCEDEDQFEFEVVSPSMSPEEILLDSTESKSLDMANQKIIEAMYPGAKERYTSVLKVLSEGGDRVSIARVEKCSVARAGHLACRVRGALRKAESNAQKIIQLMGSESWQTAASVATKLGIGEKEAEAGIAYLLHRGVIARSGHGFVVV